MGLKEQVEREDKVVSAARLYVAAIRRLLAASMIEGEARARDGSVISRLHKVNARARAEAEATEAEALLVEAVEEFEDTLAQRESE
jgi:hypothetical protein